MTERANTGGNKIFEYPKGYQPKIDEELAKNIDEGYKKAEKRKLRNRILITILIIILIILGIILIIAKI